MMNLNHEPSDKNFNQVIKTSSLNHEGKISTNMNDEFKSQIKW